MNKDSVMNLDSNVLRARYGQVNGEFKHLVTWIGAEIDFANGLCALQPKQAAAWSTTDAKLLGKVAEATEVDVLERPLAASAATVANGTARLAVPAHGLATVRLALVGGGMGGKNAAPR